MSNYLGHACSCFCLVQHPFSTAMCSAENRGHEASLRPWALHHVCILRGRPGSPSSPVCPRPPHTSRPARLTSSKFVAPVIIPLSFKPCPRVCVIPQILENSRTNMLFFRGYNDEVSNRACEGMAPYWVHPELSCVTPVVDSPPPLTPRWEPAPCCPGFTADDSRKPGSPFHHHSATPSRPITMSCTSSCLLV